MNCKAYSSFKEVSSDYRIVSAKIYLSLCINKTQTVYASQYDWSSLIISDIRNHYMVTVRNKFDILVATSERHTLNYKYKNFIITPREAAAECIPVKPSAKYSSIGGNSN